MHERGVRPVRNLREFFKGQPMAGRVFLGVFFIAMWVIAGTKPGGGAGRPALPEASSAGRDVLPAANSAGRPALPEDNSVGRDVPVAPDAEQWADFMPITSANTARTLTAEDFAHGFVMTRTGTNETHDFSAPSNATVCADWEAFGAAEDWIYIALTNWTFRVGSNEVSRFRVFSFGQADFYANQPYTSLQTRVGTVGDSTANSTGHDIPATPNGALTDALTDASYGDRGGGAGRPALPAASSAGRDVLSEGNSAGRPALPGAEPATSAMNGVGRDVPVAPRLWPLCATFGVVPHANWPRIAGNAHSTPDGEAIAKEELSPSRFWHCVTPSNTLMLTWQNVLLGRDTNTPVSVQAELWTDGHFAYRYDLSRCGGAGRPALPEGTSNGGLCGGVGCPALPEGTSNGGLCGGAGRPALPEGNSVGRDVPVAPNGALTNILVGASFGGLAWMTNSLPSNVTSLAFRPLSAADAYDRDPDGDGIPTIDELFVHGTDPHSADTDMDGLTDHEEVFIHGTDPNDPYSAGSGYSDGLAVRLGGVDPLSCPEGSTNTVLEHVFYSGTTNGAFTLPRPSDGTAVLRVSATGAGNGDLIVGGRPVPLVARRAMRSSAPGGRFPTLLVPVVKGVTHTLLLRGGESVGAALDSDGFAFGVLPSHRAPGRINFPNVAATAPCIHDLYARRRSVSLPASRDADLLSCRWSGGGSVEVENLPPRSAVVSGNFSANETGALTYSISHPEYLFGQTSYGQEVRFCPRPPAPDPYDPSPDPIFGAVVGMEEGRDDVEKGTLPFCVCGVGGCGPDCGCGCCGDGDDPGDSCPVHSCPYSRCAALHEDEYTNAVQSVRHAEGVLYIRTPPAYERIDLDVPTAHRSCCPCPEHWTNYVAVAYRSRRLELLGEDGLDFSATDRSCAVNLAGVTPSASVGDAALAFSRNGDVYLRQDWTVLGVAIRGGVSDLATLNALNPAFGLPITVGTNMPDATEMSLVTDVSLPDGSVHLELADATGEFTLWYYDGRALRHRILLDTSVTPVKDLTMSAWRSIVGRGSGGGFTALPILVTSSSPGEVSLRLRYWNVTDGVFLQDEAVQRITSVLPPLRLDVNRDGAIDGGDSAAWLDGRAFRYWVNEDRIHGDCIVPGRECATANSSDLAVNGTFDLINFFPAALDLEKFRAAWGDRVTYEIRPGWDSTNSVNFCLADVPWSRAGSIQTTNVTTLAGQPLSSASLVALPAGGVELPYPDISRFSHDSGLMVCEAKSPCASMRMDIRLGGVLLYSCSAPMDILPVKQMYSWINGRHLSGGVVIRPTAVHRIWDEWNTKSLIFLHGANVSEAQAEQWGDILFKRLWVSGVRADFYNVAWRSDMGGAANYHENASNAFAVAGRLAPILSDIPGEKVIMAHSLGNMVASSMIQDHGLQVSRYLMCNSAVPAEAYDTSLIPTNVLVHRDWNGYPRKAFANEWYRCFEGNVGDDRQLLTWGGRFTDVADCAVNFYSTGDHVLELEDNNNVWATDGYENWDQMFERYAWHKQELWKGRKGVLARLGTTDWAGWSIRENILGYNAIQPTNAWLMSAAELKTNTVFKLQPESMNTNSIPLQLRGAFLANGIPSRTPASGAMKWGPLNMGRRMINLESTDENVNGLQRPNGWVVRPNGWFSDWGSRWLHSDIKDVSYFFVFKFYQRLKEEGALQ